jgi:integrase
MAKIIPFLSRLDQDRLKNIDQLVSRARNLVMTGFESIDWASSTWLITAGRLSTSPGKRQGAAAINFSTPKQLGAEALTGAWGDVVKALICLRFHSNSQAMANQRNFVTAISYVWYSAGDRELIRLNPEILTKACEAIRTGGDYAETTAYNLYKAIHEFADYCDANWLCNVTLKFRYHGASRPDSVNGREQRRLDDPDIDVTTSEKMISPEALEAIGTLYQDVPKDHPQRVYVLMLTFLAFLGRRFSELALMPEQIVGTAINGERYVYTFPGKASRGDDYTPMEKVYVPTAAEWIIEECVEEFRELSAAPRETAIEMFSVEGPDLRFLKGMADDHRLYKEDLLYFGLPNLVGANGWARKNGLAYPDPDKLTSQGIRPAKPSHYTTKAAVVAYGNSLYDQSQISHLKVDGTGRKYYAKDMLILRHMGLSSGLYTPCISMPITHAMLNRFVKVDIHELLKQYVSDDFVLKVTSHQFRHTLNTLLDEGGLSDLMQTRWFNRSNPRDTKVYQHSSPAKKALMYREMIKLGEVGGPIAETYKLIPVTHQEAYLKARVQGVHDLGPGMCTHVFAQSPCPKHLECQSGCNEYSWVKGDEASKQEVVRMYGVQVRQLEAAKEKYQSKRKGESEQWLTHVRLKMTTLELQLSDFGIDPEVLKVEVLTCEV